MEGGYTNTSNFIVLKWKQHQQPPYQSVTIYTFDGLLYSEVCKNGAFKDSYEKCIYVLAWQDGF